MTPDPTAPAVTLQASVPVASAERVRPNMRLLSLLALGHLVIDTNQGALPAILPFLKASLALSYTATGVIVLVANVTSSLIQPLFGYFADGPRAAGCCRCPCFSPRSGSPSRDWRLPMPSCSRSS